MVLVLVWWTETPVGWGRQGNSARFPRHISVDGSVQWGPAYNLRARGLGLDSDGAGGEMRAEGTKPLAGRDKWCLLCGPLSQSLFLSGPLAC